MHLSPASRHTRVRRLLAISAAAVAVMVGPTACDYGVTGGLHGTGSSSGDMPGMDHGTDKAGQQPVIVPVANTSSANATSTNDAAGGRQQRRGGGNQTTTTEAAASTDPAAPSSAPAATDSAVVTDPAAARPGALGDRGPTEPAGGRAAPNNGLDILGRDCNAVPPASEAAKTKAQTDLELHNGFQSVGADGKDVDAGKGVATCVNTEMGAVAAENQLPSLLIVDSPRFVGMNQAFTLKVSTRNLVRDRFLGAAKGGYYLESSFLNKQGLQRGHFHTACRILDNTRVAPNSGVAPAFFLATEDGGGGSTPDVVTIPVPAIGKPGILQCTSWAGDGSHRTPMMTRANETPAIDSVRIFVTRRNQPVRYDAAAATADANANIAAQSAQAGAQAPDAKPAAPAAPNAAGTPNTPVDEAGNPVDQNAAAAPGDTAPPVADAAPASDAPAPSESAAPPGN